MNENQDNNLQNSVENSTPIEPVEMPTPIEAQAPIDEAAPVESQASVVESTPVAPTPVVEPTPVAPTSVVEPIPVAPTPVVESTPVAPTPVLEPTPVVTPIPVETPVAQPVASPVSPVPVTPPTNEKKSNPVLVVLLIIALLAVIGYGVYSYTDILKPKANKGENDTTTTTTTTAASFSSAYKSLDDYFAVTSKYENDKGHFIQETDDFSLMDFGLETRCVNDGDKVEFKIGMFNISYTCIDNGYDELYEGKVWEADVNIDNKITIKDYSFTECADQYVYTSGNYFLVINVGLCSIGVNKFTLYDYNGNAVLKDVEYSDHFVVDIDNHVGDIYSLKLLNNSNVLYFMSFDNDSESPTTCRLKAVDVGITGKPVIQEVGTGRTCYYNGN